MSRAYTLIFDGYADWELEHVLAELWRYGNVEHGKYPESAEPGA